MSQSRCSNPDGLIVLTEQDGFVPLSIHSFRCPWRVKVDQQQTLQFTLFSFGQRRVPSDCPWSVLFNEAGRTMEHPLCHATSREAAVYTSRSNAVTVRVSYKENVVLPLPYFLKYEGMPDQARKAVSLRAQYQRIGRFVDFLIGEMARLLRSRIIINYY